MAKTPKPPRPPIVPEHPKPEVAERVKNFAAVGMKQEQIARLERMDPKTLRKYYHDFWEDGYYQANANIGKSGYQLAVGRPAEYDDKGRLVREELKPDKSAAIFLMKARLGMSETQRVEHTGGAFDPAQLNLSALTDEEVRTLATLLKKASAGRNELATKS